MTSRLFSHVQLQTLRGIGPAIASRLQKLGIHTLQDLLLHLPFRYEDRTVTTPVHKLTPGLRTSIQGTIKTKQWVAARKRMLLCTVSDGTGMIHLRFMHVNAHFQNTLTPDVIIRAYGEIKHGKHGLEMIHPQFQILHSGTSADTSPGSLTPVYRTTEGLSQTTLRKIIGLGLTFLKQNPPKELLPPDLASSHPSFTDALSFVHFPKAGTDINRLSEGKHPTQKRLIFEELLAYQLSLRVTHAAYEQKQAYALPSPDRAINEFISTLPFMLTAAQQRVRLEIRDDLQKHQPMMRLLQGDVGSGKTCIAAIGALQAILNGMQVALMAPTEILAEQHYHNFKQWFEPLNIHIALIVGGAQTKGSIKQADDIACGKISLIIGTHALFYDKIQFDQLALVIIDEQHRFGVDQRLALLEKGGHNKRLPHQLIMTATPIPRTLAMTLYADMSVSTIDELPPGRTPISTVVIPNTKRHDIITRILQSCQQGRQVYWVCTLIEESEHMEAKALEEIAELLHHTLKPLTIGVIHGRMKTSEKQEVMEKFKQGTFSILVATTVIEVGVDVPNASVIIIENAERLGLAQLHQLRGRVGRGHEASHCILLYQPPLSSIAKARLEVMRETVDGFLIAERDLEIRGIGEILGTKQIGVAEFKIVDLTRDQPLLNEVKSVANYLIKHHSEHAEELIECWLPNRQKYIHA